MFPSRKASVLNSATPRALGFEIICFYFGKIDPPDFGAELFTSTIGTGNI